MSGGQTGREIATTIDSWKYKSGFVSFSLSAWDALRQCVCVCVCFCVCEGVGGCSSQSTRPSTRVGCLCGEVWTNVLLQISKITVIRNSFLFASYSLLPFSPYTEVFFMPHVAIDVVRVSVCVCVCVFQSLLCVLFACFIFKVMSCCVLCPSARLKCVPKTISFIIYGSGNWDWALKSPRPKHRDRHMSNANAHSVCPSVLCTLSTWKLLLCLQRKKKRRVADVSVNLSMLASDKLH